MNIVPVLGSGGSGSKGGGASGGASAIEANDTLESKANIKIIDLIGEGLIGGLVNGAKSIFLNNTPLQNAVGVFNFTSVTWDQRQGSPGQTIIPGFSSVESPHNMSSVAVTYATPQSFTITNSNVDRVRVIVNIPALFATDTATGNTNGTSVTYHFRISTNGAAAVNVGSSTVNGKTKSKYQRSHVFTLPKPLGTNTWTVTMVRDTLDSGALTLSNATQLDSYVEIVDVKINYANSAIISVGLDPKVFSSPPNRAYHVDGLFIQVPSNRSYNSTTKVSTYSGVWNGSFITATSANPAWILYDLLTTKRYGLGNYLLPSQVDKAMLYTIGQYCDAMVDNGLTGTEPRFTINTQIQTQAEAYKLISDICSAFRGMAYWNGGIVSFRQDSPQTPTMVFNQANVINGEFSYASSSRKDRHSVVNVTWNDPVAHYQQRVEYIEDHEQISAIGIKPINTVAFGCTSRGQANRVGRWILYSERYESNLITFKVGLDSSLLLPGEVVRICDAFKAGKRAGGRVISSTTTSVVTDSPVTLSLGSGGGAVASIDIFIAMPDGSFAQRTITQTTGTISTLSWTTPLQIAPSPNAVFVLSDTVVPMLARVSSVAQDGTDPTQFTVTATQHNPSKFAAIENGMLLKIPQTSVVQPYVASIDNIAFDESTYFIAPGVIGSKLHVYWEGKAASYKFSYRISIAGGADNWKTVETKTSYFDIEGLAKTSVVDVSISGLSLNNTWTTPAVGTFTIVGKSDLPAAPTGLTIDGGYGSVTLNWVNSADIDLKGVNIYQSSTNNSATAVIVGSITGNSFTITGISGSGILYFWLKSVSTSNLLSVFNTAPTVGTSVTPLTVDSVSWSKTGIVFSVGTTNQLVWTAGTVLKNAVAQAPTVNAGSQTWTTGTLYIYYNISSPATLLSTTSLAAAVATGNYPLATYTGGSGVNIKGGDGSAFISGSQVIAGTVGASQLVAGSAVITGSAQIASGVIGSLQIGDSIESDNFSVINQTGWQLNKNTGTTAGNIISYGTLEMRGTAHTYSPVSRTAALAFGWTTTGVTVTSSGNIYTFTRDATAAAWTKTAYSTAGYMSGGLPAIAAEYNRLTFKFPSITSTVAMGLSITPATSAANTGILYGLQATNALLQYIKAGVVTNLLGSGIIIKTTKKTGTATVVGTPVNVAIANSTFTAADYFYMNVANASISIYKVIAATSVVSGLNTISSPATAVLLVTIPIVGIGSKTLYLDSSLNSVSAVINNISFTRFQYVPIPSAGKIAVTGDTLTVVDDSNVVRVKLGLLA